MSNEQTEQLLDEPLGDQDPATVAIKCCQIIYQRQTAMEAQIAELTKRFEELGAVNERQLQVLNESLATLAAIVAPNWRGGSPSSN
jgi:hypothetical protein